MKKCLFKAPFPAAARDRVGTWAGFGPNLEAEFSGRSLAGLVGRPPDPGCGGVERAVMVGGLRAPILGHRRQRKA